jgi:RES domain-containing protein
VHLEVDAEDMPRDYQLLGVEVPDGISAAFTGLPDGWRDDVATTRALGDAWLREGSSALLRVPSAIVPDARNYLLNPAHADEERIAIVESQRAAFDPRLMAFVKG